MKKVKTWILLALAFTFLFPIQAFASALPENTFLDVPESSPYYEAVYYLADKGIISYAENFRPDDGITSDEFALMLVKAFYPDKITEPAPEYDLYFPYRAIASQVAYNHFDRYDFQTPDQGFKRRYMVYMYTLGSAGISPYPSETYNIDSRGYTITDIMNKYTDLRDYACAAYMMGLADPASAPDGICTRGEAALLFYQLMVKDYVEQPEPDIIGRFDRISISPNVSEEVRNGVITGLALLPDKIIDAFNEKGWRLRIGEKLTNFYPFPQYVGLTVYNEHSITMGRDGKNAAPNSYITVHEFGHFIHATYNLTLAKSAMYRYELDAIVEVTREYAATNADEAFAEMFAKILCKQNNTEKLMEIQEKAPLSYAIIQYGIIDADTVCDLDIIEQAVTEYTEYYTAAA